MPGLTHREDTAVVANPTGQLHPHRQAARPKPDRDRQSGQADQAGRDHHLHPAVIGVHGVGADALRPAPLHREGPDLRRGQGHRVKGLEQPRGMGVPARPDDARLIDGLSGQGQALLDFPDRLGLQLGAFGRGVVKCAKPVGVEHGAQGDPGVPEVLCREGRGNRLHDGAQRLHLAQGGLAQVKNARLHGIGATPVGNPGDALSLEAGPVKGCGIIRNRTVKRHFRVGAGLHLQQAGHVLDGAPHRPFGGERGQMRVTLRIARHQPPGRTEPVDVAERRRIAQRAHHVRPIRHRQHP